jgi:hypothetical protein
MTEDRRLKTEDGRRPRIQSNGRTRFRVMKRSRRIGGRED